MFLRFCDPSCHEQVIEELNGVEWPVGYGKHLNFEFNRNYTRQHHLLARERYVIRDACTQTDPQVTANPNTLNTREFGSTSSLSTFCLWTAEDFTDNKYSIFWNEDDASTVLDVKSSVAQKQKIKSKGSVRTLISKFLLHRKRID
ncbi:unnamed protein product [Brachionus calyciflorus]|uniref:Uncharacterized protein n=1 Tax=Brachionus calyciflorus TaxID=104777 RepID=A0A814L6K7_9BILA|nr:unnamed protein product [Brachionus calyciflorus]